MSYWLQYLIQRQEANSVDLDEAAQSVKLIVMLIRYQRTQRVTGFSY